VAFDHFLATSFFYKEDRRYSYNESKVSKRYCIGAVSGNISMAVHSVGISHSMGRSDSIPCIL
jgi:hypothetical protein